jgi:hypothetical protein
MLIASTRCAQPGVPDRSPSPRRLAVLGALPQGEVADVVLAVLVGLNPLATRSCSGSSFASLPYAGHDPIRKKIEPSSVR